MTEIHQLLENGAEHRPDHDGAVALSLAISAKRIADSLEKVATDVDCCAQMLTQLADAFVPVTTPENVYGNLRLTLIQAFEQIAPTLRGDRPPLRFSLGDKAVLVNVGALPFPPEECLGREVEIGGFHHSTAQPTLYRAKMLPNGPEFWASDDMLEAK